MITGTKAITFESNHHESGAQIIINESSVTLSNNYFEKGDRPSLIIKTLEEHQTPVITLNNNAFLFYDQDGFEKVRDVNQYDIQTDGVTSLQLINTYRYWTTRGMGSQFTYGIKMCNLNGEPISEFNNQSHLLSTNGIIKPNSCIINNMPVNCINSIVHLHDYSAGAVIWYAASGIYYYKYEILWDIKRNIKQYIRNISNSFTATKNGQGALLFTSNDMAQCGFQAIIQLYRGTSPNLMTHYVDIPISGTQHFYDNGLSICGFPWKGFSGTIENGNSDIESIKYHGKIANVGEAVLLQTDHGKRAILFIISEIPQTMRYRFMLKRLKDRELIHGNPDNYLIKNHKITTINHEYLSLIITKINIHDFHYILIQNIFP